MAIYIYSFSAVLIGPSGLLCYAYNICLFSKPYRRLINLEINTDEVMIPIKQQQSMIIGRMYISALTPEVLLLAKSPTNPIL